MEKIIKKIKAWQDYNFGRNEKIGYRALIGVTEELGELSHAHLKGWQNRRHTPAEIIEMKKDAIGNMLIYLINYCSSQDLDLIECLETAWNEIKDHDWKRFPKNGRTE